MSLISVFPLYWMFVSATNTSADILSGRIIPGTKMIENLKTILEKYDLTSAFINSFRNAACLTILALVICSLAGYGFEIYHDKKKDRVMNFLLLGMMVPFIAIVVPLYKMFASVGLLNSMWAVIIPTISTPFLIFLFRQSNKSFPMELIHAARIDGLNEFQIFYRIYTPIMKSVYVTGMTVTFMNAWNAFMWPNIVLFNDTKVTLPILLSTLMTGYEMDYGAILLCVSISTIPTIVIFLSLHKAFANGITGSVKG